jgi:hypothetical protein
MHMRLLNADAMVYVTWFVDPFFFVLSRDKIHQAELFGKFKRDRIQRVRKRQILRRPVEVDQDACQHTDMQVYGCAKKSIIMRIYLAEYMNTAIVAKFPAFHSACNCRSIEYKGLMPIPRGGG